MLCKSVCSLSENQVTPESVYLNRRQFINKGIYAFSVAGLGSSRRSTTRAAEYPDDGNRKYVVREDSLRTPEEIATSFNNYYEFSLDKDGVKPLAQKWKVPTPWKVEIGGLVEKEQVYELEDLIKEGLRMDEAAVFNNQM